jgi:hypothetical protein
VHHIQSPSFNVNISGTVTITVLTITLVSTLAVCNTELLRRYNRPQAAVDSEWGFGQILPMFLVVLPLKRTVLAFCTHGFRPKPKGSAAGEKGRKVRLKAKLRSRGIHSQGGSGSGSGQVVQSPSEGSSDVLMLTPVRGTPQSR